VKEIGSLIGDGGDVFMESLQLTLQLLDGRLLILLKGESLLDREEGAIHLF